MHWSSEHDQDNNIVHTTCEHLDQLLTLQLYTGGKLLEQLATKMAHRFECCPAGARNGCRCKSTGGGSGGGNDRGESGDPPPRRWTATVMASRGVNRFVQTWVLAIRQWSGLTQRLLPSMKTQRVSGSLRSSGLISPDIVEGSMERLDVSQAEGRSARHGWIAV